MTVKSKIKLLLLTHLLLYFFEQCKTKTERTNKATSIDALTTSAAMTRFNTIMHRLKTRSELTKSDILALDIFDTSYSKASTESVYCDTTVQLNDSIFYSIVQLPIEGGNCSHYFILTINENHKMAIASRYLKPDCDIDYSWDSYDLFDYKIISKDTIELTQTTVFQKKNKISEDEAENIDHKHMEKCYFVVQPGGFIKTIKK